jgi:hypothetical protein
MIDFLLIVFGLAGQLSLGIAVALLIVGRRLLSVSVRGNGIAMARAELIGLGIVLGIAANSYLLFLWSYAGGPLNRTVSLTLAFGEILAGIGTSFAFRVGSAETQAIPSLHPSHPGHPGHGKSLARCCAWLILALFVAAVIQSLLTPQRLWDERAYYGMKAMVLFQDQSIRSADLANVDFVQGHPRYPLLIPLAEHHLYALLGHVDDRLAKVLFPLMYLGLVMTFAGVLMRHVSLGRAWLGALLLATVPALMPDDYGFLCGQADAPVGCYEGVALFYLWDLLACSRANAPRSYSGLILAGIAGSMVAFTKDEGIAHGLVRQTALTVVVAACVIGDRRRAQIAGSGQQVPGWSMTTGATSVVLVAAIQAVILLPWFLHRRHLPLTGEMNYFGRLSVQSVLNGLPTLAWSIPHMLARMFGEARIWGLQWWFALAMGLLFPKRALQSPQMFLVLVLAGDIAALLLAGMIAPVMLEEHIGGSSHRYLMQLIPAVVLFGIGQLPTEADGCSS